MQKQQNLIIDTDAALAMEQDSVVASHNNAKEYDYADYSDFEDIKEVGADTAATVFPQQQDNVQTPQTAFNKPNKKKNNRKAKSIDKKDYPPITLRGGYMKWLALIAMMIVAGFAAYNYGQAQDSDQWWLFATGQYIAENGIPYTNPFSIWDNQGIVIQQWLPALITWLVYDSFGYIGIGTMVVVLMIALVASMLLLIAIVSEGKPSEIAFFAIAGAIGVCSAYLSVRPQVWSMIAFILLLCVLERYRRTNNIKILILLPIIVALHANVHMSMMPFDFVIVVCYLLPTASIGNFSFGYSDYKRIPLLISLFVMALASLLNPYGLDGALYLLNSYGAADYGNYIAEMGTLAPANSYYGMMMVIMIAAGAIAIGANGSKRIDLPLVLLFVGTAFVGFQHVRNVWLVALFAFALIASASRGSTLKTNLLFLRDDLPKTAILSVGIAAILIIGMTQNVNELLEEPTDSRTTPIEATDWLDANASSNDGVFTHFNAGGYVEYRGYKVSMDARPELWNIAITGFNVNRYNEYIDMTNGDISENIYLSDKEFKYAIVNDDTDLYNYMSASTNWTLVLEGSGYGLFQRNY